MSYLSLTPEQAQLKQVAAKFVQREAPSDRVTSLRRSGMCYDANLYAKAAALGWLGMLVPEEYGGWDLAPVDCAVLFEELGRGPVFGPLFSSNVLCSLILMEAGTSDQKSQLLPSMVSGEKRVALAVAGGGPSWGPGSVDSRLLKTDGGYLLEGHTQFVHDAAAADVFLCAARGVAGGGDGISLALVDRSSPGVSEVAYTQLFLTGLSDVAFSDVLVSDAAIVGAVGKGWNALEQALKRALPILCAFAVGACAAIFDLTLEYTRQRFAFGQPIGRFQRVQDHMIELANYADGARLVTAELFSSTDPSMAQIHEAAAVTSLAYYQVCNYAHMVFAGPGTDLDHPLMTHTILSRQLYQYLGDPTYHKRRMMDFLYAP